MTVARSVRHTAPTPISAVSVKESNTLDGRPLTPDIQLAPPGKYPASLAWLSDVSVADVKLARFNKYTGAPASSPDVEGAPLDQYTAAWASISDVSAPGPKVARSGKYADSSIPEVKVGQPAQHAAPSSSISDAKVRSPDKYVDASAPVPEVAAGRPDLYAGTLASLSDVSNVHVKAARPDNYADASTSTPTTTKPPVTTKHSQTKGGGTIDDVLEGLHRGGACIGGWGSKACYDGIIRLAFQRQQFRTVVLVVVTDGTYDVVLNWCASMLRIHLDNYILVALDEDAHGFFRERGAPVVPLLRGPCESEVEKSDVWIRRTLATYMILKHGMDVLVCDVDAVMMKSPFTSVHSHFHDGTLDMISSPSNFPNPTKGELPDACPSPGPGRMEWRHWPCMGWMLMRSSAQMREFFLDYVLRDVLLYGDDQIGFNCAVRRAGAEWEDGVDWNVRKAVRISSKRPWLELMMLPGSQFVRNCTEFAHERKRGYGMRGFDEAAVELYHCKGYHKKANAVNNDFWFIHEDWEDVSMERTQSFSSYLLSISVINRGSAGAR
ncbi:glycosyl transferase-like protein similarity to family GT77 [Chondrus crispus]|uniref:Glycosyl transferase-like protein similarity to family GT77 n=1 Tax=Chondrus crispus TaxID=2769 RepID=R7QT24_CHOCR|nr:glycosyl transferase-like protein similarity to family GT77 [Chondrus crispus]CDF40666.1 glycosyl transferase-like protein similarity to family GT77 [Chondrus crispus]|eukprot:XP_005710960.1 glycosyl transferase-like protein similarity to family GT77 [Chondrus crispus]